MLSVTKPSNRIMNINNSEKTKRIYLTTNKHIHHSLAYFSTKHKVEKEWSAFIPPSDHVEYMRKVISNIIKSHLNGAKHIVILIGDAAGGYLYHNSGFTAFWGQPYKKLVKYFKTLQLGQRQYSGKTFYHLYLIYPNKIPHIYNNIFESSQALFNSLSRTNTANLEKLFYAYLLGGFQKEPPIRLLLKNPFYTNYYQITRNWQSKCVPMISLPVSKTLITCFLYKKSHRPAFMERFLKDLKNENEKFSPKRKLKENPKMPTFHDDNT